MSNFNGKTSSSTNNTVYYEFCLDENESVVIGSAKVSVLGTCFRWGRQAKFGIIAPESIDVSRLEIFAKQFQTYNQEMELTIGDSIAVDDLHIEVLHKVENMGSVLLRVTDPKKATVKESLFNKI